MIKKNVLLFVITNVTIFLPSPPYLAYGIILIVSMNCIFTLSIFYSYYLRTVENSYRYPLLIMGAGIITVLLHQGISFFSPVIALTLGFIIYLIPLSFLTFDIFISGETNSTLEKRKKSFKILFYLSILSVFFFVIREFFSFGSISYPTASGIYTIDLPIKLFEGYAFFWSSIPGSLVILILFMVILPLIIKSKKEEGEE